MHQDLLEEIAPNLFVSTSSLSMGGVVFPLRMVVVRLEEGLWVHSPVPAPEGVPFEALTAAVAALGEVRWLVAPCLFHHVALPVWSAAFPDAEVWAPAGIEAKQPSLRVTGRLEDALPAAWGEVLLAKKIDGVPKMEETVFLHRPTQSLIVTDLLFNLEKVEGWMSKMTFGMAGALNGPAQSRLFRLLTKDREAAGQSVRELLALDFERLIMAHGAIVERGGKEVLERACWWMLQGDVQRAAVPAA